MKARHRRFAWIGAGVAVLGVAVALVLNAFQSNLVFFFTPTQVAANEAPQGPRVPHRRAGRGQAACTRERDGLTVHFCVTDTAQDDPGRLHGHPARPVQGRQGRGRAGQARPRRRLPRDRGARQARRELHAAGGRRRGRQGARAPAMTTQKTAQRNGADAKDRNDPRTRTLRADPGAAGRARRRDAAAASAPRAAMPRWMALARPAARGQFLFVAIAFGCLAWSFVTQRFLGAQRRRPLQLAAAAAVPVRRDLGLARRLAAAVGARCSPAGRSPSSLLEPPPARRRWSRACSA